jgi:hypothetical protein
MTTLADSAPVRAARRVPTTVHRKLLAAFAGTLGLVVVFGVLGLRELIAANNRAVSLGQLQQRVATYREIQNDVDQLSQLLVARDEVITGCIEYTGTGGPGVTPAVTCVSPPQPPNRADVTGADAAILAILTRLDPFSGDISPGAVPPPQERGILTEIHSEYRQLTAAMSSTYASDVAGTYGDTGPQANEVTALESKAERLVSLTQADTNSLIAQNHASYLDLPPFVVGVAGGSTLLVLLLGFALSRSRIMPIKWGRSRRAAVAAGEFSGHLDVPNRIELGAVARREEPATIDQSLEANAFVREGEFWSLSYGGAVVRLKDSKGLRDIARLLATPGREVAAIDLTSRAPSDVGRTASTIAELGLSVEADAGEALDADARAQYRCRLAELEEEVSEAEANNDPERASRTREEREFLLAELGAAVGLGGRPRRLLDPAERARKAVAGRVYDAITHIEKVHRALGRHLRRSVRTGTFCVYDPAESTVWRLSPEKQGRWSSDQRSAGRP